MPFQWGKGVSRQKRGLRYNLSTNSEIRRAAIFVTETLLKQNTLENVMKAGTICASRFPTTLIKLTI
jgi:hypothetical protein